MLALLAITSVKHPSPAGLGAAIVAMIGTIAYIRGLALYARAKGHTAWWCLLGLISLAGLAIVAALPDLE